MRNQDGLPSPPLTGIRSIWHRLSEPDRTVEGTEPRRRSRLLSSTLLLLIPVAVLGPLSTGLSQPGYRALEDAKTLIIWCDALVLALIYLFFSRTVRYQAGAVLTVALLIISLLTISGLEREAFTVRLIWLAVPILLGSLLLPLRRTMFLVFVTIAAIFLMPLFFPTVTFDRIFSPLIFITVLSLLLLFFAAVREQDLARLKQESEALTATREKLYLTYNELEARVRERTIELSTTNSRLIEQIVERERTEEALARRNRELALLNRVIAATTSALDVEEVLGVACRELALAFDVPQSAAALFNETRSASRVVAEYQSQNRPSALNEVIPVDGNPATQYVLAHKQPLGVVNAQSDPRLVAIHDLMRRRGTVSLLILPLIVQDEVVGTIGLDTMEAREFTDQELALAASVTAAVSQALYNARLFEAEREQRALAEALSETAAILNSTLDLDEVLDRILVNVGKVVDHESACIMLVSDDVARVVRSRGYKEQGLGSWVEMQRLPVEAIRNLRQMRDAKQPIWVPDTRRFEGWVVYPETSLIRSHIGAPMFIGDTLVGFILLDKSVPDSFTPAHAESLQAFANQAAVTMHNASLHKQAEHYASQLEQRVAERTAELKAANEHLQALARVKDEFVSNVSHELRTPITNLMLRHSLLARQPDKVDKHLAVLQRETERLNNIIEDLLRLSRLDQEQTALDPKAVDLNELAYQYVTDRRPVAESRGLVLELEQQPALPLVWADDGLLGLALGVLLTNALNYTLEGGRVVVKTKACDIQGSCWTGFSVDDTGPGIPPDEQPRLFERFFRGKVGRNSGIPGTGLGLAMVREIVSRHNGYVEVASEGVPGRGTTFSVWLPALVWEGDDAQRTL